MKLYHQSRCGRVSLWEGDSLQIGNIGARPHAAITDPPYSSGGMYRGDRAADPGSKYTCAKDAGAPLDLFGGDNKDQWSHTTWSAAWMSAARAICRDSAPLLVFTDWRQIATQITAVQWGGWVYRGLGVWDKGPGARPCNTGAFGRVPEYVVHATAGPSRWSGDFTDAVLRAPGLARASRAHIAQKPPAVADWLASFARAGETVLDPFCGSGALLAGALRRGCFVIGVDLSAAHLENAKRLLLEELALLPDKAPAPMDAEPGRLTAPAQGSLLALTGEGR